jgi:hypothetical protein
VAPDGVDGGRDEQQREVDRRVVEQPHRAAIVRSGAAVGEHQPPAVSSDADDGEQPPGRPRDVEQHQREQQVAVQQDLAGGLVVAVGDGQHRQSRPAA